MPKINVTVELELDRMPDDVARDLARQIVEAKGLNVSKVAVKAERDRVKTFTPKAYAPGWRVNVGGRVYEVWSQAEHHKGRHIDLWVVPVERREGDAMVYRFDGHTVRPFHGDGRACASRWTSEGSDAEGTYRRVEIPCDHKSHRRESVAA